MPRTILAKTAMQPQQLLSMNMRNVDELFPGFEPGNFAAIYKSSPTTTLASLLCIRAQLPTQLGGLNSDVIFIDGENGFSKDQVYHQAKIHHLDPQKALSRIHVFQGSSAFEMTTLVLERLKDSVEKYNAKVVLVSNIARLFESQEIPEEEGRRVFSQVVSYLQNFANEKKIIVIATFFSSQSNSRNASLKAATIAKANVAIAIRQTLYDREFNLEKHPHLMLGTAEYPSENLTLVDFLF